MKFAVINFPGASAATETIDILTRILGLEAFEIWHKDTDLKGADFVILPGGSSYGDYLRAGAIAKLSPIMDKVIQHAHSGGYVLGIGNGFQILCEAGLLPGALTKNDNLKFISKNTYIKADNNASILNENISTSEVLKIPIAHEEGRYFAEEETLKELKSNGQMVFIYCDENGEINEAANPNGSFENIAGICNKNKNVFGIMPHPERAAEEEVGNTDGLKILEGLVDALRVK